MIPSSGIYRGNWYAIHFPYENGAKSISSGTMSPARDNVVSVARRRGPFPDAINCAHEG
jgi:hypothetical protein